MTHLGLFAFARAPGPFKRRRWIVTCARPCPCTDPAVVRAFAPSSPTAPSAVYRNW